MVFVLSAQLTLFIALNNNNNNNNNNKIIIIIIIIILYNEGKLWVASIHANTHPVISIIA